MSKFSEWAQRHAKIFGFTEADYSMVLAWEGLFAAANYSPEDLADATDWLATNAPPAWPRDHLKAIQDRIRSCRAIVARSQDEVADWECKDCGGSGRVTVPHLDSVKGEDWLPRDVGAGPQYYTCAVRCHCWRGINGRFTVAGRKHKQQQDMMHFGVYEQRNPNWRRQLADREHEKREEAALLPVDPKWAAMVDRLTASMKAKRAEEHS